MSANHRQKIARRVATLGRINYTQALDRVEAAARAGVLPSALKHTESAAYAVLAAELPAALPADTTQGRLWSLGGFSGQLLRSRMVVWGSRSAGQRPALDALTASMVDAGFTGVRLGPRTAGPTTEVDLFEGLGLPGISSVVTSVLRDQAAFYRAATTGAIRQVCQGAQGADQVLARLGEPAGHLDSHERMGAQLLVERLAGVGGLRWSSSGPVSSLALDWADEPRAHLLSSAALAQLVAGAMTESSGASPAPVFVVVDDADMVSFDLLTGLLACAQPGSLAVILAFDNPCDVEDLGALSDVDVTLVLRQRGRSASLCSSLVGGSPDAQAIRALSNTQGYIKVRGLDQLIEVGASTS